MVVVVSLYLPCSNLGSLHAPLWLAAAVPTVPCTDSVGLIGCGRPYGVQYSLAELERLANNFFALLALSGLTNEMARHLQVKKQQVMASKVGFC